MAAHESFLAGAAAPALRVRDEWVGWKGVVAHPESPLGGGGPGSFRSASPLGQGPAARPSFGSVPPAIGLAGNAPPLPARDPPETELISFSPFKSIQNEYVDVEITAQVIRDGNTGVAAGAKTKFSRVPISHPGYRAHAGKITKFKSKLSWRGVVTIQTSYAPDASPKSLSCYGRGTTAADIRDRNITLGFHESCHRSDFINYLKSHPLPPLPQLATGMDADDYQRGLRAFFALVDAYWADMEADSQQRTDEVGFKQSTHLSTNTCQVHVVP